MQHHKYAEVHPGQQIVYGDPEHGPGEPGVPAAQARDRFGSAEGSVCRIRLGLVSQSRARRLSTGSCYAVVLRVNIGDTGRWQREPRTEAIGAREVTVGIELLQRRRLPGVPWIPLG